MDHRRQLLRTGSAPGIKLHILRDQILQQQMNHQAALNNGLDHVIEIYRQGEITRKVRKVTFATLPPPSTGMKSKDRGRERLQNDGEKKSDNKKDRVKGQGAIVLKNTPENNCMKLEAQIPCPTPTASKHCGTNGKVTSNGNKENTELHQPQGPQKARSYNVEEVRAFMDRREQERKKQAVQDRRKVNLEMETKKERILEVLKKQREAVSKTRHSPGQHKRLDRGVRKMKGQHLTGLILHDESAKKYKEEMMWRAHGLIPPDKRHVNDELNGFVWRRRAADNVISRDSASDVCNSSPLRLADLALQGNVSDGSVTLSKAAGDALLIKAERVQALREVADALAARVDTQAAKLVARGGKVKLPTGGEPRPVLGGHRPRIALDLDDSTSISEELPWSEEVGEIRADCSGYRYLAKGDETKLADIIEKQEEVVKKLRLEQAEIQHLKSLHQSARQQRKLLLQHQREIVGIQQSAAQLHKDLQEVSADHLKRELAIDHLIGNLKKDLEKTQGLAYIKSLEAMLYGVPVGSVAGEQHKIPSSVMECYKTTEEKSPVNTGKVKKRQVSVLYKFKKTTGYSFGLPHSILDNQPRKSGESDGRTMENDPYSMKIIQSELRNGDTDNQSSVEKPRDNKEASCEEVQYSTADSTKTDEQSPEDEAFRAQESECKNIKHHRAGCDDNLFISEDSAQHQMSSVPSEDSQKLQKNMELCSSHPDIQTLSSSASSFKMGVVTTDLEDGKCPDGSPLLREDRKASATSSEDKWMADKRSADNHDLDCVNREHDPVEERSSDHKEDLPFSSDLLKLRLSPIPSDENTESCPSLSEFQQVSAMQVILSETSLSSTEIEEDIPLDTDDSDCERLEDAYQNYKELASVNISPNMDQVFAIRDEYQDVDHEKHVTDGLDRTVPHNVTNHMFVRTSQMNNDFAVSKNSVLSSIQESVKCEEKGILTDDVMKGQERSPAKVNNMGVSQDNVPQYAEMNSESRSFSSSLDISYSCNESFSECEQKSKEFSWSSQDLPSSVEDEILIESHNVNLALLNNRTADQEQSVDPLAIVNEILPPNKNAGLTRPVETELNIKSEESLMGPPVPFNEDLHTSMNEEMISDCLDLPPPPDDILYSDEETLKCMADDHSDKSLDLPSLSEDMFFTAKERIHTKEMMRNKPKGCETPPETLENSTSRKRDTPTEETQGNEIIGHDGSKKEIPFVTLKPTGSDDENSDPLSSFRIGDRVLVCLSKPGVLKFKGLTKFSSGYWAGVALDKPEGHHNGTFQGIQYFSCPPKYGVLVRAEDISHLLEDRKNDSYSNDTDEDPSSGDEEPKSYGSFEKDLTTEKSTDRKEDGTGKGSQEMDGNNSKFSKVCQSGSCNPSIQELNSRIHKEPSGIIKQCLTLQRFVLASTLAEPNMDVNELRDAMDEAKRSVQYLANTFFNHVTQTAKKMYGPELQPFVVCQGEKRKMNIVVHTVIEEFRKSIFDDNSLLLMESKCKQSDVEIIQKQGRFLVSDLKSMSRVTRGRRNFWGSVNGMIGDVMDEVVQERWNTRRPSLKMDIKNCRGYHDYCV
ncbi:CE350 protein, partial [Polypterus senegalus]